jgi:hypothetical protein
VTTLLFRYFMFLRYFFSNSFLLVRTNLHLFLATPAFWGSTTWCTYKILYKSWCYPCSPHQQRPFIFIYIISLTHRGASTSILMSAISDIDIDICYSYVGDNYVGLNTVIRILTSEFILISDIKEKNYASEWIRTRVQQND